MATSIASELYPDVPLSLAICRYEMVRDEVRQRCPAVWAEVVALCQAVPDEINALAVWKMGRDKPCWSNIRVPIGQRIAEDITRSTDFDFPSTIASDEWQVVIRDERSSRRWRRNDNFDLRGRSAVAFMGGLQRGGLASYVWRLYAIRNFAISLTRNDSPLIDELVRSGNLATERIQGWSAAFAQQAGKGWGYVTVNHLLTDLGVAAKNDLHLTRSIVRMGLFPRLGSDTSDDEIRRLSLRIGHQVVRIVIQLSEHTEAPALPGARSPLREMDKVLMEWSRQGFARPL